MFIINILDYFKNVTCFQYLIVAFAFYGTFLCVKKVIIK